MNVKKRLNMAIFFGRMKKKYLKKTNNNNNKRRLTRIQTKYNKPNRYFEKHRVDLFFMFCETK